MSPRSLTLVAKHQCHCEQPEFATKFTLNARVQLLESVDEHESQENDVLRHLSCGQDRNDPFSKSHCRYSLDDQGLNRGWCSLGLFDIEQREGGFEPEQACYLTDVNSPGPFFVKRRRLPVQRTPPSCPYFH